MPAVTVLNVQSLDISHHCRAFLVWSHICKYITSSHALASFPLFSTVFHIKIRCVSAIRLSPSIVRSEGKFATVTQRRTMAMGRWGAGTCWGSPADTLSREPRWGLACVFSSIGSSLPPAPGVPQKHPRIFSKQIKVSVWKRIPLIRERRKKYPS